MQREHRLLERDVQRDNRLVRVHPELAMQNDFERRIRLDGGDVETVRVIGVDTPETVKPDTPVQCFGPQASAFEHAHAEGRRVRLLVGVEPRDVYGRLLAYVWVLGPPHPRFLEVELLRRGLARTLTFHPNDRFAHRFEDLERFAAKRGKGLWNAC